MNTTNNLQYQNRKLSQFPTPLDAAYSELDALERDPQATPEQLRAARQKIVQARREMAGGAHVLKLGQA